MTSLARALFVACLLAGGAARAATQEVEHPMYAIVIGYNGVPEVGRAGADEDLVSLRYADDDAVYFHSFIRAASRRAFLLAALDADSQRRHPDAISQARPPTLVELDAILDEIARAMKDDRASGRQPVLVFFYSGHGVHDPNGAAALALVDGTLNQQDLYERVLARLPAQSAHLIVDACHAEGVVRPRDADAKIEPLGVDEERGYLAAWTLARFPHVGALLASASTAQTFEWEPYRGGVFTHEVLSGLRGAADVNLDGRVEYSELAAFLAAANLRVSDPRSRPHVVIQPPRGDRRTAIIDLATLRGHFRLTGRARGSWPAPFFVETENATRLLDVHPEPGAKIAVYLPAGPVLHLVRPDGEVEISASAGQEIDLASLRVVRPQTAARGAAEASMRKGLFAASFGTGFYEGYMSQQVNLTPIVFPAGPAALLNLEAPVRTGGDARRTVGRACLAATVVGTVAAVVAGGLALRARSRYEHTDVERDATEARRDFGRYSVLTGALGAVSAVLGLTGAALISWSSEAPSAEQPADGLASARAGFDQGGGL